jgi:dTDP-4-amino-4,6-dideoxygalactose transaminase
MTQSAIAGSTVVEMFEARLAEYLDVEHVVAVSSGTAALHTGLFAAGVRPGDTVLVPALTVVMSAAAVRHLGARPVFVDCDETGTDFDYADLAAKAGGAAAIMPVYLWGRAPETDRLRRFAAAHTIPVVADACQAIGTTVAGRQIGLDATIGCFSTHELKLLSTGEGGFLATDDPRVAEVARAYRTHWQTPPTGSAPLAELGHNFRLAAPLASVGCSELEILDATISHRIGLTTLLAELLAGVEQLHPLMPGPTRRQRWNHYAPLFRLDLPRPRAFAEHLSGLGVPNSTGTFRLIPLDRRPLFRDDAMGACRNAAMLLDGILAVALTRGDEAEQVDGYAELIAREVTRWDNA